MRQLLFWHPIWGRLGGTEAQPDIQGRCVGTHARAGTATGTIQLAGQAVGTVGYAGRCAGTVKPAGD